MFASVNALCLVWPFLGPHLVVTGMPTVVVRACCGTPVALAIADDGKLGSRIEARYANGMAVPAENGTVTPVSR